MSSSKLDKVRIPVKRNDGETLQDRMNTNAYTGLLNARYMGKNPDGSEETQEEVFPRVARNIAIAEIYYKADELDQKIEITTEDIKEAHSKPEELAREVFGEDTELESASKILEENDLSHLSYNNLIENDDISQEVYEYAEEMRIEYESLMSNLNFMPNTPTIMNAGQELQMLSACFVISPEDDMRSIHQTLSDASMVMQAGGGMGYGFWKLRPYGDRVGNDEGISSGPLSFMQEYDVMCEQISQGRTRRGAQMGVMKVSHPDVIHFIHAKNKDVSLAEALRLNDPDDYTHNSFSDALEEARELIDSEGKVPKHLRNAAEGHLSNFNISVGVTDDFMDALDNGEEFTFTNPRTNEPHIVTEETKEMCGWFDLDEYVEVGEEMSMPAEVIWERMMDGAYENGEPGVVYIERMNKRHSFDVEENPEYAINSTNPCLSGDMEVAVVGEEDNHIPIEDLAERDESVLVYSLDEDGSITVKEATAFKTKENARTVSIETDGNLTLELTPDHEVRTNNRGWVEANGLTEGDSLRILREWVTNKIGGKDASYKMVSSNSSPKSTHRLVARDQLDKSIDGKNIHHKNYDSLDNRPENLEPVTEQEPQEILNAEISGEDQVKIVENHKVVSISNSEDQDVYDLNVPETHNFFAGKNIKEANSFVFANVHNCGEQALSEYEACNLGHINLSTLVSENADYQDYRKFVSETDYSEEFDSESVMEEFLAQSLDWDELNRRIDLGTRFLENVVTMSDFPVEKITESVTGMRKIGLGIMGLAQLYVQLGLAYGSEPANEAAEQIMTHINHQSKVASRELAEERGVFDDWTDSKYANPTEYPEWFTRMTGEDPSDWEEGYPMRNHSTTTIAPTGSTSMLGNTTGGCEPMFNVAYYKNVTEDVQGEEMLVEFDDYFLRVLEANDIDVEAAKKEAYELMEDNEFETAEDLETVPNEIAELFVTTGELSGREHASVQCSLQKGVDSSISKTLNFPNDVDKEEMSDVFEYVYNNGGKGVTAYRDGTRSKQVLTTRSQNKEFADADSEDVLDAVEENMSDEWFRQELAELLIETAEEDITPTEFAQELGMGVVGDGDDVIPTPRERGKVLYGTTEKIETGYGNIYVTVNEDEDGLVEVFAQIGKSGGFMNSFTESVSRLISVGLRSGIPPRDIIDHLEDIRSPKIAWDDGDKVHSIPDAIAMAMERYLDSESRIQALKAQGINVNSSNKQTVQENGSSETLLENITQGDTQDSDSVEDDTDGSTSVIESGESPECPECGAFELYYSEGCKTCESCGWSEC